MKYPCFKFLATLAFSIVLLSGCAKELAKSRVAKPQEMNSPAFVLGVPLGTAAMFAVEKDYSKSKIQYFNSLADGYTAVKSGKIDAFAFDRHTLQYVVKSNPDLAIGPWKIAKEEIVVGAPLKNADLIKEVDAFIKTYRKDGVYKEMYKRWISDDHPQMPPIPAPVKPSRTLRVGTEGFNEPMNYYLSDGSLTGFDIEFIKRLALALNAKVDLVAMGYDALIPAVESGKIDLLIASLNATEERRRKICMSDTYVDSEIAFLMRKDRIAEKAQGTSLSSFSGKRISSLTGAVFDKFINAVIPNVEHVYFNDYPSMIEAVRGGKVEAMSVDDPVGRMICGQCRDLKFFPEHVAADQYGFAVRKGDPLAAEASKVIRDLQANGGMKEIASRWLSGNPNLMKLPAIPEGKNGVLRFGHDTETMPMSYCGENKSSLGFDVELAVRIASALNKRIELVPIPFGSLIASLNSGKVDMVGGCMSITEERKKNVDFTDAYYIGGIALLVKGDDATNKMDKPECLAGKRVGVLTGTKFDQLLTKAVPTAIPEYFMNNGDQVLAMKSGKIAAYVVDEPVARYAMAKDKDISYMPDFLCKDEYALIINPAKTELCRQINQVIAEMKKDGSLQALQEKWFAGDEKGKDMPPLPDKGTQGTLRAAITIEQPPFCYLRDGKPVGYELELLFRIAAKLNLKLELSVPELQSMLMSVSSGRCDIGLGCISVTEERKKSMLFSDPHYYGGVVIMTPAFQEKEKAKPEPFLKRAAKSLEKSFVSTFLVEGRYKLILSGLWVTLLITLASAVLGTVAGFGICMLRRARSQWVVLPTKVFIQSVQGTPIVVLLMILYYIVFGSFDINAIVIAIIGFSLNFAAYVSEMMRTGIDAVDKGQIESALAMGFKRHQVFWEIVFPQAAKHVLPVYKGEFISMLKSTSIVGYIAIQDLTKMSDIIRSRTYDAFFPLIVTALIYFGIAYAMAFLLSCLEASIDPKQRERTVKGVVMK